MTSLGPLLRVLCVLGVIVALTAATYLAAGLSVGAWLMHERSATQAWLGSSSAANQALLALPALAVGCVAAWIAIGVRARRRQPLDA